VLKAGLRLWRRANDRLAGSAFKWK
jgi:hypothetical protein